MTSFGEWLKTARASLKFTQEELGERIGKSKSWVVDVERGRTRPKLEDVATMAFVLNASREDALSALLADLLGFAGGLGSELPELDIVAQVWAEQMLHQEEVDRVRPRSRAAIERSAEELGEKIFEDLGVSYAVPLQDLLLAGEELDQLSQEVGEPVSIEYIDEEVRFLGATERKEGRTVIKIRGDVWRLIETGDGRARFTLAHEIGHAFLHRDELQEGRIAFRDAVATPTARLKRGMKIYESPEWQANVFASALLMPKKSVQQWIDLVRCEQPDSISIADMAETFGVSFQAARIRIERLLATNG